MQPYNYTIDVKNPFDNAVKGIATGLEISSAMDKAAQQRQAADLQKQMQIDLAELSRNPNPTAQDFARLSVKYPTMAEHFKNTYSVLSADQQQVKLGQASQVFAALNAGKPDIAINLLTEQATAAQNAGRAEDAKMAGTLAELIKSSPETAKTSTGLFLANVLGPDKFTTTFSTLAKLPAEVRSGEAGATKAEWEAKDTPQRLELANQQTQANIRNIDSQISERAARLGLDRDKAQSDVDLRLLELNQKGGKLDDSATKIVNESTVASVTASQAANSMTDLASRLEKQGGGYGAAATAAEWIKQATGNQDAMTQMRQEYTRLRNTQAIKNLPPGPATDKDIALALKGFPPENADAGTIASFLRGMAKMQNYTATMEGAKAEWVNAVGHLGKPKTDINIDGINVPAGSTFTDFATGYMDKLAGKRSTQGAQQGVPGRSYMRWAQQPGQLGSGTYNPGQ